MHERAAKTHDAAADLHQEAANLQELHALEMREAGRPSSAKRAERLADKERELVEIERAGARLERERAG
jgi:hypothetical protein